MKFWVTPEERSLIFYKMSLLPTTSFGKYIRKMAIDGYIVNVDTSNIKAFTSELHAIGCNINQIAKVANSTGFLDDNTLNYVKKKVDEIWQLQRRILLNQQ